MQSLSAQGGTIDAVVLRSISYVPLDQSHPPLVLEIEQITWDIETITIYGLAMYMAQKDHECRAELGQREMTLFLTVEVIELRQTWEQRKYGFFCYYFVLYVQV
jgi:hypothetical protein